MSLSYPSKPKPEAVAHLDQPVKANRRRFNRSLEGLRGVAALGVLLTHVWFQTGMDPKTHIGAIVSRFDFFVAVFFSLSAFLLWRGMDFRTDMVRMYYWRRFWRIYPAYFVCVAVCVAFVPETFGASAATVIQTFTFTQLYFPHSFLGGLTHLWSLCVEVAFYVVLPVVGLVLLKASRRVRLMVIFGVALVSLGWAYLPVVQDSPSDTRANMQIFLPGFFLWFAVGLVIAELEGMLFDDPTRLRILRLVCRWRFMWWSLALAAMWLAGQQSFGPVGLVHPSAVEFMLRVIAGGVCAWCIVAPYVFGPASFVLESSPMQFLGKISYSVFLWHVPVLTVVLPLAGVRPFTGNFVLVCGLTVVVSIVVGFCSYVFVEAPLRKPMALLQTLKSSSN
ncbi:putative acyltransferase [Corynebacterium mustelae]|uniref:Putative acyltransferase n=1 Tax=Corynebacterium mustelae TaxID=571915 RepID=A0A0G3H102_9CORY|nr:acyltransferase [Corynebacterium mustelae]AKK07094.1 putative acyltransferase [Corynebacterium mustelae]